MRGLWAAAMLAALGAAARAQQAPFDPAAATVEPDAGLDQALGRRPYVATFFDPKGDELAGAAGAASYCVTDTAAEITTPVKPIRTMTAQECAELRLGRCPGAGPAPSAPAPGPGAAAQGSAEPPAAIAPAAADARLSLAPPLAVPEGRSAAPAPASGRPLQGLSQLKESVRQGLSALHRFFDGSAERRDLPSSAGPRDSAFSAP